MLSATLCQKNLKAHQRLGTSGNLYCLLCLYIYMGCLQNVGSRKRSKFAFCLGPAFWRIHFSDVLFFKKKSRWLNSLSLFPKIVPSLTASAYFLKLKKTPGKVRNRSETPKRQHLPSIHPSIHLISYHCYFYFYYYYYYFYYLHYFYYYY